MKILISSRDKTNKQGLITKKIVADVNNDIPIQSNVITKESTDLPHKPRKKCVQLYRHTGNKAFFF